MEPPTTKLKAGQTGWIMENNTPTEIKIYRVMVAQESGANNPNTWSRTERYMSLRPSTLDREARETRWYDSEHIHATKAELLASL